MSFLLTGLVGLALVALGARLLGLARGTGQPPERWLGLAFTSAGASATLLAFAASGMLSEASSLRIALLVQVGMAGAVCSFVHFTWLVFRSHSQPALWIARALIVANLASLGALVASGSPLPSGRAGLASVLARCGALLWLFFESALHAQRMRRRLQIGLADPIVANRFVLWSIWTGALALIPLFVLALRVFGGLEVQVAGAPLPAMLGAVLAVLGGGGAAAALAVWLAFFPPSAYQRWLVADASSET